MNKLGQFEDGGSFSLDFSNLIDFPSRFDLNPTEGNIIDFGGSINTDNSGIDWGNLLEKSVQTAGKLAPSVASIVNAVRTGTATLSPYGTSRVIATPDGKRYLLSSTGALTELPATGLNLNSTSTLILLAIGAFLLMKK